MSLFQVHTIESAPQGSKPALEGLKRELGLIPNLAAAMGESPELLRGFLAIREIFYAGSLSRREIQVVALTNAFENSCDYCMSLHSTFALKAGVAARDVEELRAGRSPIDPKLSALSDFARKLVRQRGAVSDGDLRSFMALGYTKAQALEVLAYPEVPLVVRGLDVGRPSVPIVPVSFSKGAREPVFDFFSTVTTLGTPQDITLQELRIECFFPANTATEAHARTL